jgi:hypothetical protein
MTMHEHRANVIAHHIRVALQHGLTMRRYATDVAAHYFDAVPLHVRGLTFAASADPYANERHNAQLVTRFIDGPVRMPVECEESLIAALPQPYRGELLRELSERVGLLAVPIPRDDGARAQTAAADVLRETGELITALASAMADGKLSNASLPMVQRALREVRDVQATVAGVEHQLLQAMAQAPKANVASIRGAA